MKALVIVHPSSLDAYTHAYGERAGDRLSEKISAKIKQHDGPVFLLDQQWPMGPESGPRQSLYQSILPSYLKKDILVEPFDEGGMEWVDFLKGFKEYLKNNGVDEVVIGGLWYDLDSETGAVADAYREFSTDMPSTVDENIVAIVPGGRRV